MEAERKKFLDGKARIRPATPDDINFIFNSWLKSYRNSKNTDNVANEIFFYHHHKVLEGLCRTCSINVLCNNDDPSQIYGYICHEMQQDVPVVHFVYIKEVYRRLGLAKLLMEDAGINLWHPFFFTHRTNIVTKFEADYLMIHNPYLACHAYELIRKEEIETKKKQKETAK